MNSNMVLRMPDQKELEKIGGLFNLASIQNRPFLDKCSETKYLAVRDYDRAADETLKLAKQAIKSTLCIQKNCASLSKDITTIRKAIDLGKIDSDFIDALANFRSGYLEHVLRPVVQTYLSNEEHMTSELEEYYTCALRIEGLLGVVQFLKRVKPVLF